MRSLIIHLRNMRGEQHPRSPLSISNLLFNNPLSDGSIEISSHGNLVGVLCRPNPRHPLRPRDRVGKAQLRVWDWTTGDDKMVRHKVSLLLTILDLVDLY